jgi:probable HAF family extracellular repeat protein
MKSKTLMLFSVMTCLSALTIPIPLAAQDSQAKHHHYKLIDLGTFGGPASAPGFLSERGIVLGAATVATPLPPNSSPYPCGFPFVSHGFEWQNGSLIDLGPLPGGYCSNAGTINSKGEIAGNSEIGEIDPLFDVRQIRAVVWADGQMKNLGTLGGNESAAAAINNRGEVVGQTLNAIPDPFSFFDLFIFGSSAGTQTRAFLWQNGVMQDLGTLGGPDALATLINERGQVTGYSYTNSIPNADTGIPTADPFLWENGRMTDLGSLGGTSGLPFALNNRGQVVGDSNLAGDLIFHPFSWDGRQLTDLGTLGGDNGDAFALNDAGDVVGDASLSGNQTMHAVLWKHGVITDLGTVEGDTDSMAMSINSKAQVVGTSSTPGTIAHAFLWEEGSIVDLNDLIPPSGFRLLFGLFINDSGEIAGIGFPPGCEASDPIVCGHSYLLIPCDENHPDIEGCNYSAVEESEVAASHTPREAAAQEQLTPQEITRIQALLMNRHRGLMPRTIH